MIKIYHNPRCKKSREGLKILEQSGKSFQIVKYLNKELGKDEIKSILKMLDIPAEELIRSKENIWKENYKGKELSEDELIEAMQNHPKLIERPIVEADGKAIIGRPPEKIKEFIA